MMSTDETEYGPGRTIPHPILFRVLDSEADDTTVPEIKVEHTSEFAYYPGCVDYYDMEMQFSHVNYGDTNHGIIFDSSIKRGQPAQFPLNGVIPCWTEGLQRMKVGGKAKLVCPSSIAYGDQGRPPVIPGGATLVFEVELLEISKPAGQ